MACAHRKTNFKNPEFVKTLNDLIVEVQAHITEWMPWDLSDRLQQGNRLILLDVREPNEFSAMHIPGSINVPRGVLENACEYDFDETVPELVEARTLPIAVICRSGNRSALAAFTMQQLGYQSVYSLKTGLRGWNDYDQPLIDATGKAVDADLAEEYLRPHVRQDQRRPA